MVLRLDTVEAFIEMAYDERPQTWLLILRLDSDRPKRASPMIAEILSTGIPHRWSEAGLAIPLAVAAALVHCGLFNGFDQVALFDDEPLDPAPCPVTATTDRDIGPDEDELLRGWLAAAGATALAADGLGLRTMLP